MLREVWKSMAIPSIMCDMDVTAWNESEIDKLDVGQNRVARMALNAPRYTAAEVLRGDMGWNIFRERQIKATLKQMEKEVHKNDKEKWITSYMEDEKEWEESK
ncbi:hypothetical protein E2C01_027262 [Portunus trituberculatus]|uniref:Uncharacterized protein n=1 Tax=Portunus trituberculatus TaxID=210409 RepID=A0A5B7EKD1_PORTR|nr:hypothetical protein [Portunus trituberculatus]